MISTRLASSAFRENKGLAGWGALSRGLVNPGLGHCHLRILFWVGRKAPFDLLLLSFGVSTRRFREQKHSRTRRKLSILQRFYFHGVSEQLILIVKQIFASKGSWFCNRKSTLDGRESCHLGEKSDFFRGILLSKQCRYLKKYYFNVYEFL